VLANNLHDVGLLADLVDDMIGDATHDCLRRGAHQTDPYKS
jgi:hypothetical protein